MVTIAPDSNVAEERVARPSEPAAHPDRALVAVRSLRLQPPGAAACGGMELVRSPAIFALPPNPRLSGHRYPGILDGVQVIAWLRRKLVGKVTGAGAEVFLRKNRCPPLRDSSYLVHRVVPDLIPRSGFALSIAAEGPSIALAASKIHLDTPEPRTGWIAMDAGSGDWSSARP